jgi:ATPase subunit of ABC transporter with duplicated ATPase domains
MASVRFQRVSFSWSHLPLLEEVTAALRPGWTGVVGPNGSGKSTLLGLLAGSLAPASGQVLLQPRGARVARCEQTVERLDPAVRAFASDTSGAARAWHGRLALDPSGLERWATLSPGERKRWQVGAALAGEPEVLLLDEPTNHLDARAVALTVGALRSFRGVGVLVSHHRDVLDALCQATWRVAEGRWRLWPGAYTEARAAWEQEEAAAREAHARTARALDATRRRLEAQRRQLEGATRNRSAGARMKDAHDSDARSLGADFHAEMAERAHAGRLRRTQVAEAELEGRLGALEVRHLDQRRLFVGYQRCPRPVVARFEGPLLAGAAVLAPRLSLQLGREAHVVLEGPNGAGKSTLLRALLAASGLPEERTLRLPQELSEAEAGQDLAALRAQPREVRGRTLQVVEALGVAPEALLRTEHPSAGEARKLRLALGLARQAWLAVLDEPTNHLDLPSVERLQAALEVFPGALLLVTHDAALAEALGRERWTLEGGVLTVR